MNQSFSRRHPITMMVFVAAIVVGSGLAMLRMKVDIFPNLNLPVIYVAQPYGGMDPGQMEGLIANYYEYHFLYISGIHHVESKNVQGTSLMKLFFHPGTDMAQAMGETVGYVNRSRAFMPPGTVQPFIMRFDTGSVPVGYLVLSSDTKTIGQIQDKALFKVRPMFAALPGVSAPPRFGGTQRTIVSAPTPTGSARSNIAPEEVIKALTTGNTHQPLGQHPRQGSDADRRHRHHGGRSPGTRCDPDPARPGRVRARPGARSRIAPTFPPATPSSTAAERCTSW